MSKPADDSEVVVKWLSDKLSQEELTEFQESSKYVEYQKIFQEVESWAPPTIPFEEGFSELIKKRDKTIVVHWYQRTAFKIAASLILVLSAVLFLSKYNSTTTTISTGVAETREILLPDSSTVYLAASSVLSYNSKDWSNERKLTLRGTAFFEVTKGSPFTVSFNQGAVQVLGTSFEIQSSTDFSSVTCYEGEIEVESDGSKKRLRKGMGIRIRNGETPELFDFENLSWSKDISRFQSTPLSIVFDRFSAEFDLEISTSSIDLTRTFTGAYSKGDVDSALDIISNSMGLTYKRSGRAVTFE